uniref:SFRICE_006735 n=1 Tax=Spodoptera frugiperda TaxID=7108 RepID=A0A2H1VLX7_SPOFR
MPYINLFLPTAYAVTSWGGAAKSHLLKLERAQRAILKVSLFLPFRHPSYDLYQRFDVLTVRQLFILYTVLKMHSQVSFNAAVSNNKRRFTTICPIERKQLHPKGRGFDHFDPRLLSIKLGVELSLNGLMRRQETLKNMQKMEPLQYLVLNENVHTQQKRTQMPVDHKKQNYGNASWEKPQNN